MLAGQPHPADLGLGQPVHPRAQRAGQHLAAEADTQQRNAVRQGLPHQGQLTVQPGHGIVERGLLRPEHHDAGAVRQAGGQPVPAAQVDRAQGQPAGLRPQAQQAGRRVELVLDHQQAPAVSRALVSGR